jgi:hypothetical protein
MNLTRFACTAVLVLGVAQAAAAQSAVAVGTSGSITTTPGVVATVDVSRLPIDVRRIERQFRQGQTREERNGLDLRYYVDVFAKAPQIKLFTKADNLEYGQAPYGGPTHNQMLEQMTPREYRYGGMSTLGGMNLLSSSNKR